MRKIKINAFLIIKSCRCSAISPEKNRVIAHYLVSKSYILLKITMLYFWTFMELHWG